MLLLKNAGGFFAPPPIARPPPPPAHKNIKCYSISTTTILNANHAPPHTPFPMCFPTYPLHSFPPCTPPYMPVKAMACNLKVRGPCLECLAKAPGRAMQQEPTHPRRLPTAAICCRPSAVPPAPFAMHSKVAKAFQVSKGPTLHLTYSSRGYNEL